MGAGRVIAIDRVASRLEMACAQGGDRRFRGGRSGRDVLRLTGGIGVDRVIDAVGVDAMRATHGPAAADRDGACIRCGSRGDRAAPQAGRPQLVPGDGPSQVRMGARGRESRHGRGDRRIRRRRACFRSAMR